MGRCFPAERRTDSLRYPSAARHLPTVRSCRSTPNAPAIRRCKSCRHQRTTPSFSGSGPASTRAARSAIWAGTRRGTRTFCGGPTAPPGLPRCSGDPVRRGNRPPDAFPILRTEGSAGPSRRSGPRASDHSPSPHEPMARRWLILQHKRQSRHAAGCPGVAALPRRHPQVRHRKLTSRDLDPRHPGPPHWKDIDSQESALGTPQSQINGPLVSDPETQDRWAALSAGRTRMFTFHVASARSPAMEAKRVGKAKAAIGLGLSVRDFQMRRPKPL